MRFSLLSLFIILNFTASAQQNDSLSNSYFGFIVSLIYDAPNTTYLTSKVETYSAPGFRLGAQALLNAQGKVNYVPRFAFIHSYAGNVYSDKYLWNYFPVGFEFGMTFRFKFTEKVYMGLDIYDRTSEAYKVGYLADKRNNLLGGAMSFGWISGDRILFNPELSYGIGYLFHNIPGTKEVWMHTLSLSFSILGSPKQKEQG